jgi:hypothetical protein
MKMHSARELVRGELLRLFSLCFALFGDVFLQKNPKLRDRYSRRGKFDMSKSSHRA